MMNRAALATLTLALVLAAAPAEARETVQPGTRARACIVLQLAAAAATPGSADPALVADLEAERAALGADLAADPAARESFRAFRLGVPEPFRPALEPVIDRMVEAAAGSADPTEARRLAEEAFPDRAGDAFDPARADDLRTWLVQMNWLPAKTDARGMDGFLKGMQKSGTFLFEDEGCYAAGHVHDDCPCSYGKIADYSSPVNENGKPYVANREARLFGSFTKTFTPSEFWLHYLLQVKPGNTAAHHPAYPDAADLKFRNFGFGFTLRGSLQEAGLYTRWLASGAWQNEEQELAGATLAMAAREKAYWEKFFGKRDGDAKTVFSAAPPCPTCGSLEKIGNCFDPMQPVRCTGRGHEFTR